MDLKDLKFRPLEKFTQAIVFNQKGIVIESDDSLVAIDRSSYNVFEDSMFCGMEDLFAELKEEEELAFDCIVTDVSDRTSYYDFIVKRLPGEGVRYGWLIYDHAKQYEKLFALQQERNEAQIELKRHQREAKSKNL